MLESTETRNDMINIPLPLMIFIRMHSQESQFHNECLICSIMSVIYVQVATFVSVRYTYPNASALLRTKTLKSYITGRRNIST